MTPSARRETPLLGHPLSLAGLVTLALNDHVLKHLAPGWASGKLSDVGGLIFFPLLLVVAAELVAAGVRRPVPPRGPATIVAVVVTGVVFAAVKLVPAATATFSEVLGALQWLVALGPITGAARHTVAVVTDPTDLVALPALVVPLALGLRGQFTAGLRPGVLSLRSLSLLFVAALASVATSQPVRSSSVSYEVPLQLGAGSPTAVRHLSIAVANRDADLDRLTLSASALSPAADGSDTREATPGVVVELAPDAGGGVRPSSSQIRPNVTLIEPCRQTCAVGVLALVRLLDPAAVVDGAPVATTLVVELAARATGEPQGGPVDIDLQLVGDPAPTFDGTPATLTTTASGRVQVGSDNPQAAIDMLLTIPAQALSGPLGYPLMGRVALTTEVTAAQGDEFAHSTHFEFLSEHLQPADQAYYSYFRPGPPDDPTLVDLLPLCRADTDCEVRAMLKSEYDARYNSPDFDAGTAVPGWVELAWTLTVRLDAYDGRQLPSDGLTVEVNDYGRLSREPRRRRTRRRPPSQAISGGRGRPL